jgi:hypothetical protein
MNPPWPTLVPQRISGREGRHDGDAPLVALAMGAARVYDGDAPLVALAMGAARVYDGDAPLVALAMGAARGAARAETARFAVNKRMA